MASKHKLADHVKEKVVVKKKKVEKEESSSSSEENDSDESESSEQESEIGDQEIDIDFEGKNIIEDDFHGIKMLLQQLFVALSVNISKLTELIISQSEIGSTLKVINDEEETVYGISTIVDLNKNKEDKFVKEFCNSLKEKCKESSKENVDKMTEILEKRVGLLVNERFINIPEDVAAPMAQSMKSEINEAQKKGTLSQFDYVLLVAKSVKPTNSKKFQQTGTEALEGKAPNYSRKGKKKTKDNTKEMGQLQFINQEDELFFKESFLTFNYSVTNVTGFAVSGEWAFHDVAMDTYRTVMIIDFAKFDKIMQNIGELFS